MDERDSVLAWLSSQGYPMELRVAKRLADHGWDPQHAHWFEDLETGKLRELDILADLWVAAPAGNPGAAAIQLAIECKASTGKPWVLFSSERQRATAAFLYNRPCVDSFSTDAIHKALHEKIEFPKLLSPERLSHGIVKCHSDNKTGDPTSPYSAIQGAIAGAAAVGRSNAELALSGGSSLPHAMLVVPVVVVDTSLYEYRLDARGEEQLASISHAALSVATRSSYGQSAVWIVTLEGLPSFLQEVTPAILGFLHALAPHGPIVVELLKARVDAVGKERAL